MTLLDAAAEVLRNAGGGGLHYREILRRILQAKLWSTNGCTPDRTLNAALTTDIRRKESSRFVQTGRGVYALRIRALVPTTPETVTPPTETNRHRPPAEEDLSRHSFADAAEAILREEGTPLHYQELTRRVLDRRLVTTSSRTPAQTMYVAVLQDMQRRERSARDQRFVRQGRGLFGLATWIRDRELDRLIEQHNAKVRGKLHEELMSLPPKDFEGLVARLMGEMGMEEPQVTQMTADGGIDIRGTLVTVGNVRVPMVVQVKRWKRPIPPKVVRELRGSLSGHERGLLVTTSHFTPAARHEAEREGATPIDLLAQQGLVDLLVEHSIGVKSRSIDALELDAESLRAPFEEET